MIAKTYIREENKFVLLTTHKYNIKDRFLCDDTTHNIYAHFNYTGQTWFEDEPVTYYVVIGPFRTQKKAAYYKELFLKNLNS